MKFADDKFESQIRRNVANASRGKIISGAFEPDGNFVITANGKISPSISYLQQSFGTQEAWDYLSNECGAAHSVKVGRFISNEIDY